MPVRRLWDCRTARRNAVAVIALADDVLACAVDLVDKRRDVVRLREKALDRQAVIAQVIRVEVIDRGLIKPAFQAGIIRHGIMRTAQPLVRRS